MNCPQCEADSLSLIGMEPNGDLMYRCPNHQKVQLPHHFSYFSTPASDLRRLYSSETAPVPGSSMDPPLRLEYLQMACDCFLRHPVETDYVIFQSGNDWCQGVQFIVRGGLIVADVNSRQWDPCDICHNGPLDQDAVTELESLGFIGGEPRRNYRRIGLSPVPVELARLTDELFQRAYGVTRDFAVGVRFRHGDVAEEFLAMLAQSSREQATRFVAK